MFQTTTNRRCFFFSSRKSHPIATSLSCACAKASMAFQRDNWWPFVTCKFAILQWKKNIKNASGKDRHCWFHQHPRWLGWKSASRKSRLLYNLYFQRKKKTSLTKKKAQCLLGFNCHEGWRHHLQPHQPYTAPAQEAWDAAIHQCVLRAVQQ